MQKSEVYYKTLKMFTQTPPPKTKKCSAFT